jgi:hypothetical protein
MMFYVRAVVFTVLFFPCHGSHNLMTDGRHGASVVAVT